jgi:hypothetical protein
MILNYVRPAGRPEAKRGKPHGQRPRLRFHKVCDEQNGFGKNSEDHNSHTNALARCPSDTKNAQRDLLFQATMILCN